MPFFCRDRARRVANIALPAAFGSLVDMTQVLIDFFMVGFLGVFATGAVGVALQFMGLFYTLMGVFYVGSNALMSRFLGAGDADGAGRTFGVFAIAALALSVPAFAIFTTLSEVPFLMMSCREEVVAIGGSYLFTMAFALPAMTINQIAFSLFGAAANIKTPMFVKIASNILNAILSYALIFGVEPLGIAAFGAAGAAAATVVAFYFETACYAYLILRRKKPIAARFEFDRKLFLRGLKIGVPAGLERLVLFGSFLVFMRIINIFGDEAMAGYQVGLRVESIAFMPGIGFTIAAMSLTGRALGAKNPREAERDALFTAFMAAVIMGIAGVLMVVFAEPLARIFIQDPDPVRGAAAIVAAKEYLVCVGLSQAPLGVGFVLSGALRGAGDTKTSLYINFASMWIFRILPAIALALIFNSLWLVWLATLFETWMRGLWLWAIFRRGKWKEIKV